MTAPDKVPDKVLEGVFTMIRNSDEPMMARYEELLIQLRWAGDHYCIPNWHGMYVGIELDGYVHS